jgi:hypothetical protein
MGLQQLPTIEQIVADPAASYWLKDALKQAVTRDPLDALHDAITLTTILRRNVDALNAARHSHAGG